MSYEYRVEILEHHLDSFGHVNNAVYMQLFEQARWDLMTREGYGLKEVEKFKIGPVILEATIRYRRELRNREWITINTRLEPEKNPRFVTIYQDMVKEDGEVAASAAFKCGLLDLQERKLIAPTPEWLKVLGQA